MLTLDTTIPSVYIYLVICSRGPGSETMIAHVYSPLMEFMNVVRSEEGDENFISETLKAIESPEVVHDFGNGIYSIYLPFADEGPVYVCHKEITVGKLLKTIIMEDPGWDQNSEELIWYTAMYRAIINNWNGRQGIHGKWSSVCGWRDVSYELMPKWQVEQCFELFDLDMKSALTCNCPVLRASAKLVYEGKAVTEYRGC